MSTLDVSRYTAVSVGLFGPVGGPDSLAVQRLSAKAFSQLSMLSHSMSAINDLYNLQAEAVAAGDTLSSDTMQMAKRFLLAWPKTLPMPELALDTDGEIVFDWAAPGRRLVSVSIRGDGRLSYAAQLGARRTTHGTEALDDSVPERIVETVRAAFR